MNCEYIRSNAALYAYNELPDDQRHELESHVQRCGECAAEVQQVRDLLSTMAVLKRPEPSANLLASSRMRLQEALESSEQAGGWRRWTFDLAGWLDQLKLAPALALVLVMVGFGGGVLATWRPNSNITANNHEAALTQAAIAGVRSIVQDPASNTVEITYETLTPRVERGSVSDPAIQQLLLYATQNNLNSGVRLDSVDLLTRNPDDTRVREALIYALRYDKNPGVRLKALEGLKPYVQGDLRVRDAVLEALLSDTNDGVRSEAIHVLQAAKADTSVREALHSLAAHDQNKFIRQESKRLINELPEID